MHFVLPTTIFSLLLSLTFAKDISVTVGVNAQLAFNPSNVKADVGDTLTFSYFPKNHSVVQSSFVEPCAPLAGGFFSGFQPLSAGPGPVQFVVAVNDTKPIWVYCSQTKGSHCQMGMSMVVNEPAPPSPNTLDAYKLAAAKTGNSTSPHSIGGGVFVSLNSTSTAGGSPPASSTGFGSSPSSSGSNFPRSNSGGPSPGGSGSSGVQSFTGAADKMSSISTVAFGTVGLAFWSLL